MASIPNNIAGNAMSTVASPIPQNNVDMAYQYFTTQAGLNPMITAGIIGNLIQESTPSLKPTALEGKEGAFGVAQWRGPRLAGLRKFAENRGMPLDALETQLNYLWYELNDTETRAYKKLLRAKTVQEAARVFSRYFERPNSKLERIDKRIGWATRIFNYYTGSGKKIQNPADAMNRLKLRNLETLNRALIAQFQQAQNVGTQGYPQ